MRVSPTADPLADVFVGVLQEARRLQNTADGNPRWLLVVKSPIRTIIRHVVSDSTAAHVVSVEHVGSRVGVMFAESGLINRYETLD